MAANSDAGETAHDGGRIEEQIETVEVELAEADVERIEYEIEQAPDEEHRAETVTEWIENAIHLQFAHLDHRAEQRVEREIEVPDEIARRARLRLESARQRGKEIESERGLLDDYLMESIEIYPRWQIDDPEAAAIIDNVAED